MARTAGGVSTDVDSVVWGATSLCGLPCNGASRIIMSGLPPATSYVIGTSGYGMQGAIDHIHPLLHASRALGAQGASPGAGPVDKSWWGGRQTIILLRAIRRTSSHRKPPKPSCFARRPGPLYSNAAAHGVTMESRPMTYRIGALASPDFGNPGCSVTAAADLKSSLLVRILYCTHTTPPTTTQLQAHHRARTDALPESFPSDPRLKIGPP